VATRFEVTISPIDNDPWIFYLGDLEPGEIGSIVVAVFKRMIGEPPGWALHIRELGPDDGPS
jgi:hypothetical protein